MNTLSLLMKTPGMMWDMENNEMLVAGPKVSVLEFKMSQRIFQPSERFNLGVNSPKAINSTFFNACLKFNPAKIINK